MNGNYVFTLGQDTIIQKINKDGLLTRKKKDQKLKPLHFQVPKFENIPLIYTSFYTPGYNQIYYEDGIIFNTTQKPVYACPIDNAYLIRNGKYILGIEKFLFNSVEEMLEKYPTSLDFQIDFKKFFNELPAEIIYFSVDKEDAIISKNLDRVNKTNWATINNYNEICFKDPVEIEIIGEFHSKEELEKIMGF